MDQIRLSTTSQGNGFSRTLVNLGRWLNGNVFSKIGINIVRNSAYVLAPSVADWPYRFMYFERLLDLVEEVKGDIVECGVARGSTTLIFCVLNRDTPINERTKHIWGFDSFKGLPAPGPEDLGFSPKARKELRTASESDVWKSLLNKTGFEEETIRASVTLVPGWFADTLPDFEGSISLLHLDADLYQSTKCALENLWSKVSIGGIVVLDDYGDQSWPGERKAVDEYLELQFKNGSAKLCRDSAYGGWYIIKLQ